MPIEKLIVSLKREFPRRPLEEEEVLVLTVTGSLMDGTAIEGEDVVVVELGKAGGGGKPGSEKNCKDNKDNDGDGLTDCDDPDCSSSKWCPLP